MTPTPHHPDQAECSHHGDRVSIALAELTVNADSEKSGSRKHQMRWSTFGAHFRNWTRTRGLRVVSRRNSNSGVPRSPERNTQVMISNGSRNDPAHSVCIQPGTQFEARIAASTQHRVQSSPLRISQQVTVTTARCRMCCPGNVKPLWPATTCGIKCLNGYKTRNGRDVMYSETTWVEWKTRAL